MKPFFTNLIIQVSKQLCSLIAWRLKMCQATQCCAWRLSECIRSDLCHLCYITRRNKNSKRYLQQSRGHKNNIERRKVAREAQRHSLADMAKERKPWQKSQRKKETQRKTKTNGKQGEFSGSTGTAAAILETTWLSLSMCRQSNLRKALKSDNWNLAGLQRGKQDWLAINREKTKNRVAKKKH